VAKLEKGLAKRPKMVRIRGGSVLLSRVERASRRMSRYRESGDVRSLSTDMERLIQYYITRLSAAVLLTAMIMGSSIPARSLIPPLILGIPVIGILGFMISALIGIIFLADLWRSR